MAGLSRGALGSSGWHSANWLSRIISLPALGCTLFLARNENILGIGATTAILIGVAPFLAGWLLRDVLGKRTSGLVTMALIFVPSYLVFRGWIGAGIVEQTKAVFEAGDVITCFTTILISGSIFSLDQRALQLGFARILPPLVLASVLATFAAIFSGMYFDARPSHTFFYTVAPIMAGGINAGALPLAIGYATVTGNLPSETIAQMISAVILGNAIATLFAGAIGAMCPKGEDASCAQQAYPVSVPIERISLGALTSAFLLLAFSYALGKATALLFSWPAPLTTLLLAALLHYLNTIPQRTRKALLLIYRICIASLTYPLLFGVGIFLTPWSPLLDGFNPANIITIVALVTTLAATGFLVSRPLGLVRVDGAIVTLARAAMGGTGDISILSAARRMDLMAHAQIATRVGGIVTVAIAIMAARYLT